MPETTESSIVTLCLDVHVPIRSERNASMAIENRAPASHVDNSNRELLAGNNGGGCRALARFAPRKMCRLLQLKKCLKMWIFLWGSV